MPFKNYNDIKRQKSPIDMLSIPAGIVSKKSMRLLVSSALKKR